MKATDDVLKGTILVVANVIALFVVDLDAIQVVLHVLFGLALERVEDGRTDEQVRERGHDERERAHILLFHISTPLASSTETRSATPLTLARSLTHSLTLVRRVCLASMAYSTLSFSLSRPPSSLFIKLFEFSLSSF